MKKIFIGLFALLLLVACGQENVQPNSPLSDSSSVEESNDSLVLAETEVRHPEPDGMFEDFVYLFMQDKSLQLDRIQFPLKWEKEGEMKKIERKDWVFDSIFVNQPENIQIIDGNHFDEEDSTSPTNSVIVEWVDLKTLNKKQYKFSHIKNQWILTEIEEKSLAEQSDNDFYVFYSRFVNDDDYQQKHVSDPFYFKTFDNDIDEEIKGWVAAEQWPAYRIYMPADKINNIIYDNKMPKSNYRTFVMSSPSSGMNCNLIFKYEGKCWHLVRMEN